MILRLQMWRFMCSLLPGFRPTGPSTPYTHLRIVRSIFHPIAVSLRTTNRIFLPSAMCSASPPIALKSFSVWNWKLKNRKNRRPSFLHHSRKYLSKSAFTRTMSLRMPGIWRLLSPISISAWNRTSRHLSAK
ncbi:hypothetical protein DSECCO2_403690 [anaerobic digester metagenome]